MEVKRNHHNLKKDKFFWDGSLIKLPGYPYGLEVERICVAIFFHLTLLLSHLQNIWKGENFKHGRSLDRVSKTSDKKDIKLQTLNSLILTSMQSMLSRLIQNMLQ
jgi:hypothetical protein